MPTITQFERPNVRALSDAILKAVQSVAQEYGVHVKYGGGNFSPTNCTFKIEAAVIGTGGVVQTKEREIYKVNAKWLGIGLNGTELDKEITLQGKKFTVYGMKTRSDKILIKDASGKLYKCSAETVARALGKQEVKPRLANDLLATTPPGFTPAPASEISEHVLLEQISSVYNALSPENLCCDGELPRSQIAPKRARLSRELEALFSKLGRRVSETEVFNLLHK